VDQDFQHLRLLSIFHYVVGGILALLACLPLLYLAVGVLMLTSPRAFGPPAQGPPPFFAWFMIGMGAFFSLAGWALAGCMIAAGWNLAGFRHYMFCLVVACVECAWTPFGTVLGVLTIVVLARPSVKELFDSGPSRPPGWY
jgi:hypothetical protein